MAEIHMQRSALDEARLETLRDAALGSPYVGRSPLAGTFEASRGFGLTFTRAGVGEAYRRFDFLRPYLDLVIEAPGPRRLYRWREHLRAVNAYYVNLLLVGPGHGVGPHVDATLRGPTRLPDVIPRLVSVLYLQVPKGGGGALVLTRGARTVAHIRPFPGLMVHFRGELTHAVEPLENQESTAVRASLVCEQYALPRQGVAALRPFSIKSSGLFQTYLDQAAKRPPPSLVLD